MTAGTGQEQAPDAPVIPPAELQRGAARGFVWTVVNVALSTPVAVAVNAVVARLLGAEGYGRLATLTVALGLITQVANFGVSDATIQWGAAAHATGRRGHVDRLLRASLGYHLLVMLPLALTGAVVMAHDMGPLVLAAVVVGTVLPAALGSAALSISIENRTAAAAKIALVANTVTQGAVLLGALISHSAAGVWSTRMIAGSLLLPLNFLVLDRARRRVALQASAPRRMPSGYWRYCAYSTASGLVAVLVTSRSEVLLLDAWGFAAAAGIFSLAHGLSKQVTAPADAVAGPLIPAVTGLLAAHPDRAGTALLRVTRVTAMLGGLVLAVIVPGVFAAIPLLYGAEFGDAAWPFFILAITSCLESVVAPLYIFTRARQRNDLVLKIGILALLVDVGSALVLVPRQALFGAVVANALGLLTVLTLLAMLECRANSVALRAFVTALAPLGAATVAASVGIGATVLLGPDRLVSLAAGPALGYVSLLTIVRTLPVPTARFDLESSLASLQGRTARIALLLLTPLSPR